MLVTSFRQGNLQQCLRLSEPLRASRFHFPMWQTRSSRSSDVSILMREVLRISKVLLDLPSESLHVESKYTTVATALAKYKCDAVAPPRCWQVNCTEWASLVALGFKKSSCFPT